MLASSGVGRNWCNARIFVALSSFFFWGRVLWLQVEYIYKNIIFGQLGSYTLNMVNFGISKNMTKAFIMKMAIAKGCVSAACALGALGACCGCATHVHSNRCASPRMLFCAGWAVCRRRPRAL